MAEPVLIPLVYKCGHTVNILSPGVSDPSAKLAGLYDGKNSVPVPEGWDEKCWNCGTRFTTCVPESVTETLRLAKKGEKIL